MQPVAPLVAPAYQGKDLYVPQSNAVLPDFCVKCGQPATVRKNKQYWWAPQWTAALILAGALPYLIVVLIIRKGIKLQVPLCAEHVKARTMRIVIGSILMLGFIPALAIFASLGGDTNLAVGVILGLVLFLGGLLSMVFALNCFLRPMFIDATYAKFRGPGEEFLRKLPMKP